MARRGSLIVLEGCDRSGKSTQCKKLAENLRLEGVKVEQMKFPDRTTIIGQMINEYLTKEAELSDAAIHLLFAANRWELQPKMERKLRNGTTLIVDRYAYSGVAYTASKPGFSLEWCKQPDIGILEPDAVIFLDVAANVAQTRGDYGGERYEKREFQEKVAKSFRMLRDKKWVVINADRSIADLQHEILQAAKETMTSHAQTIGKLWIEEDKLSCVNNHCAANMTHPIISQHNLYE